ncbi:hypothetical protein SUGI_1079790 [Cryptomeria japonica]|nr:hypothetical protein SUGI_1079790 [Cryptomeria japonica]
MSFTGYSGGKKGVQSPLNGVQSPLGLTNRIVRSPTTQSLRKKQHHEDDIRKFSLADYAENCNPNAATIESLNGCQKSLHGFQKSSNGCEKIFKVSDGCQKSFNGKEKPSDGFQKPANGSLRPPKVSESETHACRTRKKGVQSPIPLGTPNRIVRSPAAPQSLRKNQHSEDDMRKFSPAGYAENCNPSAATVKSQNACQKSPQRSQKLPNGCERILEVSDECQKSFNVQEKISDGFQKSADCSKPSKVSECGMHACRSRRCGVNCPDWASGSLRPQPRNFLVAKRIEKPNQECTVCKSCNKKSKFGSADISPDANRKCVCVASPKLRTSPEELMKDNFSNTKKPLAEVGETNIEIQIEVQEHTCGVSSVEDNKDGFSEMCGNSEKVGVAELETGTMNEKIVGSEFSILYNGNTFSNDNVHAHISSLGMSNGEENILSNRNPDIIGISDPENGSIDETMHGLEGSELGESNISADCNDNPITLLSPHRDSNGNAEKFRTSEEGNGNVDEKMMEGAAGSSSATLLSYPSPILRRPRNELLAEAIDTIPRRGGERVGKCVKWAFPLHTQFEFEEALDSAGQESLDKSEIQQWRKVTCAQPFKLHTEQRGHVKEKEFMKKVQVMLSEEKKKRIPKAQGLPWTTDEPEHLVKPPVKECTKPLDVKLHTETRTADRIEFDQTIAEKLNALEQKRLEEERLQKLAEEEEIKRLRKEMIPRAQFMPLFDRPFIPRRSSKSPTIPREPKFHVSHHKRAKCISCC